MTVIVGTVGKDGTIYIGADSAGTGRGGNQSTFRNPKVFMPDNGPWFLIAFAGSFRLGQVIQKTFKPPLPPHDGADLFRFMVNDFVEELRKCCDKAGLGENNNSDIDGVFLVGINGHIFKIDSGYQVMDDLKEYVAYGSGEEFAAGAMFATKDNPDVEKRLLTALQAAEAHSSYCRAPFTILNMPFVKNLRAKVKKIIKKPARSNKKGKRGRKDK